MAIVIRIPTALRAFTDRQTEVSVEGSDVGEALEAFVAAYPDIRPHLYDENGALRSFLNVYVRETNINTLEGLATSVEDGGTIMLVPAIAGGNFRPVFGGE
ncbi:MAG: MoaD/ThiS family protein [Desulfovibrio sp.]|jgi:molybdopterin converting factor small subunit|nr:MoaD/ThiS family protein [Desulfovibrio sp.]